MNRRIRKGIVPVITAMTVIGYMGAPLTISAAEIGNPAAVTGETVAAETDLSQSETEPLTVNETETEATETAVSETETTAVNETEAEAPETESADTNMAEPEVAEAETTEPEATETETTEPEATEAETTETEVAEAEEELILEGETLSDEAESAIIESVEDGLQLAINDNLSTPLTAWRKTAVTYGTNITGTTGSTYNIRLEKMYKGDDAESFLNSVSGISYNSAAQGYQWLVMKFYIQNYTGSKLAAYSILPNRYTFQLTDVFETKKGAKMTISDCVLFSLDENSSTPTTVTGTDYISNGSDGLFYCAICAKKSEGTAPIIKLTNGLSSTGATSTAKYTYLSTSADSTEFTNPVQEFVSRLYVTTLDRDPDVAGMKDWVTKLTARTTDGAHCAWGFYASQEMTNKNLNNADYVEYVYKGMMGRASDEAGKADWTSKLDNGVSYAYIIDSFARSTEYNNFCAYAGITSGNIQDKYTARDKNYGVTCYVGRLYTQALGRAYDLAGMDYWCGVINKNTARSNVIDVATNGFFHSEEFVNKKLSNSDYVKVLYRTFLGREYDEAGLADWTKQLDSGKKTRDEVISGFANSVEFSKIMSQYGL
ncbi:MAG: DUF4214 domain-containing protein [Lachnospiraceae bacterium]|nr:DUF4214 domain-containing protein [Lachnospiraceae bacterium]